MSTTTSRPTGSSAGSSRGRGGRRDRRGRRTKPAAASTTASTSPSTTLRSRVSTLPLIATILGLPWLDFLGGGTTALGMGMLGWRMLHTPDDEWDLPPLKR